MLNQDQKKSTSVDRSSSGPRHYCTFCGSKRKNEYMKLYWYPLIQKRAWHCYKCIAKLSPVPYEIENYIDF